MTSATSARTNDPIHKASMAFEREGDERLWVHTWLHDGGHLPEHFHPPLDEWWEVIEGTAGVKLDGIWRELTPQDGPVLVARGVRHELRNTSGAVATLRTEVKPAGRLEEFLTESALAAQAGLYTARNLPSGLLGAAWVSDFALRFIDETVMCSPPPAVQRSLLPLVARLTASRRRTLRLG